MNSSADKAEFRQPLLQSSVFRDPSEIVLLIIINVETAVLWKMCYFFQDSFMNKNVQTNSIFIFCNDVKVDNVLTNNILLTPNF